MAGPTDNLEFDAGGAPEPIREDPRWEYPEGFRQALKLLYEESFAECCLPDVVQSKILRDLEPPEIALSTLRDREEKLSKHTVHMLSIGRPDLTAESLILGPEWKGRFPARVVERIETAFSAFARVSEQQALLDLGSAKRLALDSRQQDLGYRLLVLNGRAFLILEPAPLIFEDCKQWFELPQDQAARGSLACEDFLALEALVQRGPILPYDPEVHRHHLFCPACKGNAPILANLLDGVAEEQFRRVRFYLGNLIGCLVLPFLNTVTYYRGAIGGVF